MSIRFLNKGGSSVAIKPNIFMQETEPETKEGIWLQANKEMGNVVIEDDMSITPTFTPNKYGTGSITSANRMRGLVVDTDIYLISYESLFYKLDTIAKTWTKIDTPLEGMSVSMYEKDGIIYMIDHWSSTVVYKYNIADGTFETVTTTGTKPSGSFTGSCVTVNDIMYIFKTRGTNEGYTYNINTSTFSTITVPFTLTNSDGSFKVCTDGINYIYALSSGLNLYRLNISTNQWENLIDINSIVSEDNITKIIEMYTTLTYFNEKIYLYISYTGTDGETDNGILVYDIANGILEVLETELNHKGYYTNMTDSLFLTMENELILTNGKLNCSITIPYKTFEDKSIVINQGNTYATQIVSAPENIQGRIVNRFNNVWYNTTENGLDDTIPTYYGNGTEWIKFKN